MRLPRVLLSISLAAVIGWLGLGSASAQPTHLAVGDIAAAGNIELAIMRATGASSTLVGTGSNLSTILWDPAQPDTFILGYGGNQATNGYLYRATFTSATQVVTTLFAPTGKFARPLQMSWDPTGTSVVIATSYGQVHRVNATTGQVTDLTTGTQPWGSTLSCGAADPLSGDIYLGTSGGDIYRLPVSGQPTVVKSGLGTIRRILIDSEASPHYLFYASSSEFGRFDLRTNGTVETYYGRFGQPTFTGLVAASFDQQGDFVLAGPSNQLYRMPNVASIPQSGIAPSLLGRYAFSSNQGYVLDIAVIGGTVKPFRLIARPVGILGAYLEMQNVPGPVGIGYLFITRSTFLPLGAGPMFGLMPDNLTIEIMQLPPLPGSFLAFANGAPPPLTIPQFGMAPFNGETWDLVSVVFDGQNRMIGQSNLVRVKWQ